MTAPVLDSVSRHRDGAAIRFVVDGHTAEVLILRGGAVQFPHPLSSNGETLGADADEAVRAAAVLEVERAKLGALLGGRS